MIATVRADMKASDTRDRIIATAERLYRELGYQKTTVADIARELDMSPANVYRFFRSKDEINDAVGHRLLEEVIAAAAAISSNGATASERLRAVLTALERFHVERFTVEKKLHDLVAIAISDNWPMVHEYVVRMDDIFAGIIADGMASGEFRKGDPTTAARCVHTAMIRYAHPRLMVECAGFPDPTLDQLVDFCLAALRQR
ncbi:TetR/AcrR family transcriptional regulator [Xanthobacteraceae bacterium Astr-EGSB]|uniref:TetR/AcrR family transcriptional regulator n=1 Tax=Astrobacterium formosum TaxID=3069710 RepID=UPI0027ADBD79|nr:TetR/AcrR family transcriptional regulator [Xanthobacteraceae bacterium Astr-EGSB]